MSNEAGSVVPGQRHEANPTHLTSVTEKGAFVTATCSCGWYAPARRSRDKARRDADEHLLTAQA